MRLIDADAYAAEMKKRQDGCQWRLDNPVGDTFYTEREHWTGVFAAFAEAKITLNCMPTVEMPVWVNRKDRLPEKEGLYLTLTYANGVFWPQIGKWVGGEWLYCAYVHYWMPIPNTPESPKEDDIK